MSLKGLYKDCTRRILLLLSFRRETARHRRLLVRYNASSRTRADKGKMQYLILREAHTLEKALSLRNTRIGFGQLKVSRLLDSLEDYLKLHGSDAFLSEPLEILRKYLEYNESVGYDLPLVAKRLLALESSFPARPGIPSGVFEVRREDIQAAATGNFESLLRSRHSIRYFTREIVSRELLEKALELAQTTPSACNRQAWHTHVFEGTGCERLLRWQEGAKGFEEEPAAAILVTSDLRAFLKYEPFQAYVDGGMYAMNLVNALHSLGLGTITLSCGFEGRKLDALRAFGVPENEIPIAIVAVGHMEESFKVAASARKNLGQTNTYHS